MNAIQHPTRNAERVMPDLHRPSLDLVGRRMRRTEVRRRSKAFHLSKAINPFLWYKGYLRHFRSPISYVSIYQPDMASIVYTE